MILLHQSQFIEHEMPDVWYYFEMSCLQYPDVLDAFSNYQKYNFNYTTMQNHMHPTQILFRASSLALPFKFHPIFSHLSLSLIYLIKYCYIAFIVIKWHNVRETIMAALKVSRIVQDKIRSWDNAKRIFVYSPNNTHLYEIVVKENVGHYVYTLRSSRPIENNIMRKSSKD